MSALGPERELEALRRRVDELNRALLEMIEQRGDVVVAIAGVKRALGRAAFDPWREEEMLRRLARTARGVYLEDELREIFTALFRASLALQERVRLARRPLLPRQRRRGG
jgi:chorismate mutase-like protein